MELVVVSSSQKSNTEIPIIKSLFEEGLTYYHIKKRDWDRKKMNDFIKKIPKEYHAQLVLHQHYSLAFRYNIGGVHLGRRQKKSWSKKLGIAFLRLLRPKLRCSVSYQSLQDLITNKAHFDYVILKPIFDRHNITEFNQTYNPKQLADHMLISKQKVFALGGVNCERLSLAHQVGFEGAVLQGSFWNRRENKMDFFRELVQVAQNPGAKKKPMEMRAVKIDMSGRAS